MEPNTSRQWFDSFESFDRLSKMDLGSYHNKRAELKLSRKPGKTNI